MTIQKPQLTSAFFCNSASIGSAGKADCKGVFTSFFAWAYPTFSRNWQAVAMALGLTENSKQITFEISFGVRGKKHQIGQVEAAISERDIGSTVLVPLSYRFERPGIYVVHISIRGHEEKLKIPMRVVTAEWPTFSEEDLSTLRDAKSIPKSFRATVDCIECTHPHVLGSSPLPEFELPLGVASFPDTGWIECAGCGRRIFVKDLEGQMLSAIHSAVVRYRERRS